MRYRKPKKMSGDEVPDAFARHQHIGGMQPLGFTDTEAMLEGPTWRAHGGVFRHEVESPYTSSPDAGAGDRKGTGLLGS